MEYKKLCCEECVVYKVNQGQDVIQHCFSCDKEALSWQQNEAGYMWLLCKECGSEVAVDMNTPCEYDTLTTITCHIPPQDIRKDDLLLLARTANKKLTWFAERMKTDGVTLNFGATKLCNWLAILDTAGIKYSIYPFDPRQKYVHWKKCIYPYRLIREKEDRA